ncbi:MAG: response regulator [Ktedonobacterales bacterium]
MSLSVSHLQDASRILNERIRQEEGCGKRVAAFSAPGHVMAHLLLVSLQYRGSMVLHVCIVDDEPGIRRMLRFLFEEAGAIVEEAANGEAALAVLRTKAVPRVLLLDRLMPGLDGYGVLRALAGAPDLQQRTATFFMTAAHEPPSAALARLFAALQVQIVTKPFDDVVALLTQVEDAWHHLLQTQPPA